jgi:hypothetical protein
MISSSELQCVAAFSDLPEPQIEWFLNHAEEVSLQMGEAFVRQGDPADWMIVFLEGLFQWRGEFVETPFRCLRKPVRSVGYFHSPG